MISVDLKGPLGVWATGVGCPRDWWMDNNGWCWPPPPPTSCPTGWYLDDNGKCQPRPELPECADGWYKWNAQSACAPPGAAFLTDGTSCPPGFLLKTYYDWSDGQDDLRRVHRVCMPFSVEPVGLPPVSCPVNVPLTSGEIDSCECPVGTTRRMDAASGRLMCAAGGPTVCGVGTNNAYGSCSCPAGTTYYDLPSGRTMCCPSGTTINQRTDGSYYCKFPETSCPTCPSCPSCPSCPTCPAPKVCPTCPAPTVCPACPSCAKKPFPWLLVILGAAVVGGGVMLKSAWGKPT